MNRKSLYSIAVAAAFVAGYSAYNEYGRTKLSGALLANVEALAETEDEDYGYFTMHLNEKDKFDKPTGYCIATSWGGTEQYRGPYSTPHTHSRQKCCSR
ncbi:MAG: NVEALA domain-containing protein [Bacteroidaceae bacterium]|nr:NVEALA domain-containing protein [Bacteroidaceae bacterium]